MRTATITRRTRETDIKVTLSLDGGAIDIVSGVGFLDHMLNALASHGGLGLSLVCAGDLDIDDHHTVEDCALAIGQALDKCLGERKGIARFGYAYAPLDEALARCVVDLSGRAFAAVNVELVREKLGDLSCENVPHFFRSLASAGRMALHLDILRGDNDHHKAEAAFKACALALAAAVRQNGTGEVPSTKGVL